MFWASGKIKQQPNDHHDNVQNFMNLIVAVFFFFIMIYEKQFAS